MSPITPTSEQLPTLYVIVVFTVVIFALWVIPGLRTAIIPLKLFTIGWHEFCHIVAAVFSGGNVTQVTIDPDIGGATRVSGGRPLAILTAGYVGSTILGGLFVLAGFDILMSKILSFVLGLGLIAPLAVVRNKLTILLTSIYEGLLVGFWFIDHGQALRWYCLFVGIMNIFYVVWDIADDKYFRKSNDSDASQFAMLYPRVAAHAWAAIWILFEIGVLIGFVLLGIVAFKRTNEQMYQEAGARQCGADDAGADALVSRSSKVPPDMKKCTSAGRASECGMCMTLSAMSSPMNVFRPSMYPRQILRTPL